MNAAVFLDRDNTLIHNDDDLGDPEQVRLVQGAASAIASLRGLGYKVVVVTNQGGVARGKYTEQDVEAVHDRIRDLVNRMTGTTIDRFYYCPFHPQGTVPQYCREHPWRKPAPGMLIQAAEDLKLDLARSWMIGDQVRDCEAGAAAGVRTILLRDDAEELSPLEIEHLANAQAERIGEGDRPVPNFTARNLVEAVRIIAQYRKPETPEEIKARELVKKRWDANAARQARQAKAEPSVEPAVQPPPPKPVVVEVPARAAAAPPVPTLAIAKDLEPQTEPLATLSPAAPSEPPEPSAEVRRARDAESAIREDQTLRQILQELRNQRASASDLSYSRIAAMVLEMMALIFLGAALLMGAESQDTFVRWISVAVLAQLAAIAALLFGR